MTVMQFVCLVSTSLLAFLQWGCTGPLPRSPPEPCQCSSFPLARGGSTTQHSFTISPESDPPNAFQVGMVIYGTKEASGESDSMHIGNHIIQPGTVILKNMDAQTSSAYMLADASGISSVICTLDGQGSTCHMQLWQMMFPGVPPDDYVKSGFAVKGGEVVCRSGTFNNRNGVDAAVHPREMHEREQFCIGRLVQLYLQGMIVKHSPVPSVHLCIGIHSWRLKCTSDPWDGRDKVGLVFYGHTLNDTLHSCPRPNVTAGYMIVKDSQFCGHTASDEECDHKLARSLLGEGLANLEYASFKLIGDGTTGVFKERAGRHFLGGPKLEEVSRKYMAGELKPGSKRREAEL